jgi:hypothetical protein
MLKISLFGKFYPADDLNSGIIQSEAQKPAQASP